ncbi:uncharacterized protein BCR38DRAFT_410180 [Pseudomassariella vexata]|uniref:Uncharacterized protein n=1 Tax=Pseudomassariella vexata TaxID=1141098 RepID=A0A1Y2DVU4_9PEZI|nr:uncharacterized protein BCR38DRAFT_410180 [Pseudomassariella vexata]ORY63234.1 hypothetical protein BCR38DRAFT_410180 [Pseudomassariella vexata]
MAGGAAGVEAGALALDERTMSARGPFSVCSMMKWPERGPDVFSQARRCRSLKCYGWGNFKVLGLSLVVLGSCKYGIYLLRLRAPRLLVILETTTIEYFTTLEFQPIQRHIPFMQLPTAAPEIFQDNRSWPGTSRLTPGLVNLSSMCTHLSCGELVADPPAARAEMPGNEAMASLVVVDVEFGREMGSRVNKGNEEGPSSMTDRIGGRTGDATCALIGIGATIGGRLFPSAYVNAEAVTANVGSLE